MRIKILYCITLFWMYVFAIIPKPIIDPTAEYYMLKKDFSNLTLEIYFSVYEVSKKYNINPVIILAIIRYESNFNRYAISNKGACGLMQVMPVHNTFNQNIFDCYVNIELGTKYFLYCYKKSQFDYIEAIRMYNAGIYSDRALYRNWKYVDYVYNAIKTTYDYTSKYLRIQ